MNRLVLYLSPEERAACDELKARTGIIEDENLLRIALWAYARHVEPATDPELFRVIEVEPAHAIRHS